MILQQSQQVVYRPWLIRKERDVERRGLREGGGFLQGRSLGMRLVPGQYVGYNRGEKFSKMT